MKTDENFIENEVRKTLSSLDGMDSAEPKPFFYTRLRARMAREKETPIISFEPAPIYRKVIMGALSFLLIANVITITLLMEENATNTAENTLESEFFDQYYLPVITIDNLESQITP